MRGYNNITEEEVDMMTILCDYDNFMCYIGIFNVMVVYQYSNTFFSTYLKQHYHRNNS